jgi:hypothetical protein
VHPLHTPSLDTGQLSARVRDDPRRQQWSEKRGVWCIEDIEGKCLRHASSIHGQAAAKEEAVHLHREGKKRERERRAKWPSDIRRAQGRAKHDRRLHAWSDTYREESSATPFYEIFADAFDLADPDLWKSNSFAMVRPRLLIEVRAAIADLELKLDRWRTKHRKMIPPDAEDEARLARAG